MFSKKTNVLRKSSIVALIMALCYAMILTSTIVFADATQGGANLEAAKSKYNVTNSVFDADDEDELSVKLREAGNDATASEKAIVYIGSSSITLDSRIAVPENVILVAEDGAVVKLSKNASASDRMVMLKGSMFGGTYDANNCSGANSVIRFGYDEAFTNDNGIVEKVTVKNSFKEGICAMEPECRDVQIIDCTAVDNGGNGICVQKDAHAKIIRGCTSDHNGYTHEKEGSGINISHATVGIIENCVLKDNADKGLSTNSDPVSSWSVKNAGCTIDEMKGCTVTGNKQNGVYIKPKCSLLSFTGNTLKNNNDGLVASAKTASGTKGASVIKNVGNNTFIGNKNSEICSGDKGAKIYIVAGNTLKKSKSDAIYVKDNGYVSIKGSNTIESSKKSGIYANKGTVEISGNGVTIKKNKKDGIYLSTKSVGKISGSKHTITANKGAGISLLKSKLTIKGKNIKITKNKTDGIYANNKSKATIKGVKFSGNGKKKVYKKGGSKVTIK